MITNQINSYALASASGKNSASDGSSAPKVSTGSSLGMVDFMQLLAAQFTNQDPMNPTDNTEYIAQLAQFSSLQAMQDLSQITYAQYGASLVGKKVVVASYDSSGKYTEVTGVVDSINFASGSNTIVVNGKAYNLSSVMEVVNPNAVTPPTDTSGTGSGTGDGKTTA
ncbi:flagellar hook capping FlgD N-terminal domain-containing protein [Caproiciproducens sp.]|uniref:flagellar hook capping FlgD N-terminal domain-containing protein n=1 Tax=Caproiciproducens sp. TaxID=1954376 RepID=UPI00289A694A|nr:flagellar hook capping FlgD N-terminal domain-containing protein [Caproiciproducens sp.]